MYITLAVTIIASLFSGGYTYIYRCPISLAADSTFHSRLATKTCTGILTQNQNIIVGKSSDPKASFAERYRTYSSNGSYSEGLPDNDRIRANPEKNTPDILIQGDRTSISSLQRISTLVPVSAAESISIPLSTVAINSDVLSTSGPTGVPGVAGIDGLAGPVGPAGAKGADGAVGATGAAGPMGTSWQNGGPVSATSIDASAQTTLASTLTIAGQTTSTGIVNTGALSNSGVFTQVGVSTLTGTTTQVGNLNQTSGNFTQTGAGALSTGTGAVSLNGNTTVSGTTTLNGNTAITGTLSSSGLATLNSLAVTTNGTIGGIFGVAGNTTLGGTLGVTGATTLSSTLAVAGTSSFTGAATFTVAPTISTFTTVGIVRNSAAGLLSSGLILNSDITNSTIDLATKVSGILPIANGGTGLSSLGTGIASFLGTPSSANLAATLTDETGTGVAVFGTSPTLITPNLGTPSTAVLTNATGLPLTTGVSGILPIANGGTGSTTQNFVDLTTGQTIAGIKTFSSPIVGSVNGNAATVTTNANLTGDVASVGNATTLTNAPVIAKVLTGFTSGAGTVTATDSILSAFQKITGNLSGLSNAATSLSTPAGSNANGGSITANTLTLSLADAANPGIVSTGVQTFAGAKTFTGAGVFGSTLGVTGASTFAGITNTGAFSQTGTSTFVGNISQTGANTFSTGTGAVSLNGASSVIGTNPFTVGTGATTLGGTLSVAGATTLTGALTANGGISTTTLAASGATTLGSTLAVTGASTLSGNTSVGGTLGVTGNQTNTGTLSVAGAGTGLAVTNNATIGGTLGVTGITNTGALSNTGALTQTGTTTLQTATATDDQFIFAPATGGAARFAGTFTSADLTAARTWTLPDSSGTLSTGNTLYNGNGALSSARTITTGGFATTFDGTGDIVLADSGLLTSVGLTSTGAITQTGSLTITGASSFTGAHTQVGAFSQTGANTFSTGTGAISLNGSTTLATGKTLSVIGGLTSLNSAGANTAAILTLANTAGDFQLFRTDATPESSVTGSIGDLAIDSTNGTMYLKNSGSTTNTGWSPVVTNASGIALSKLIAASATNTIDNATFAQTWNWNTTTTQNPFALSANVLTTGSLLSLTSTSTALTSGGLLNVSLSGAATSATGYVATISNTSATSTAGALNVSNNGTGHSFRVDDATGDTTPFVIDNAGNVGIGTTTPLSALHIESSPGTNTFTTQGASTLGLAATHTTQTVTSAISGASGVVQNNGSLTVNLASDPGAYTFYGSRNEVGTASGNTTALVTGAMNGTIGIVSHNGTGTIGSTRGGQFTTNNMSTGTITTAYGSATGVTNSSTGTINNAYGVSGQMNNTSTGTITNGYGLLSRIAANTGTITTYAGTFVSDIANTGTITNTYGMYVGDITTGTQTNTPFSFYASDANAYNYFAGNVGIGTASPSHTLQVNGNIMSGGSTASTWSPVVGLARDPTNITTNSAYMQLSDVNDLYFVNTHSTGGYKFNTANGASLQIASAGNVGIGINSHPDVRLYSYYANTNQSATKYAVNGYLDTITTVNGAYTSRAGQFTAKPQISIGVTNSGSSIGIGVDSYRSLAGDLGTLGAIYGGNIAYGHVSGVGSSAITTSAYGTVITPYAQAGTVTNMYDLYLNTTQTGGTLTNHFGVYQADANSKNHFAGNVGIGTTSPAYALDVVTNRTTTSDATARYGSSSVLNLSGSGVQTGVLAGSRSQAINNSTGNLSYLFGSTSIAQHLSSTGVVDSGRGSDSAYYNYGGTTTNAYGSSGLAQNATTGTLTNGYGTSGTVQNVSTGTLTTGRGLYGLAQQLSTGTFTNSTGVLGLSQNLAGGTINAAQGVYGYVQNIAAGTINSAVGGEFHVNNIGAGTVGSAYGLNIDITNPSGTVNNAYGIYLGSLAGTTKYSIYQTDATAPNYFAGNVGIGTTSPTAKIEVAGTNEMGAPTNAGAKAASLFLNAANSGSDSGGTILFGGMANTYAMAAIKSLSNNGSTYGIGHLAFYNRRLIGDTSMTESMRITYDGNVGIGTASPVSKLDVYGAGSGTSIATTGATDTTTNARIGRGSIGINFGTIDNGTSYIQNRILNDNTSNYSLAINPNGGNVGIGTTAPTAKLHVTDSGSNLRFGYNLSSGSSGPSLMLETASNVYSDIMWNTVGADQVRLRGSTYGLAIGGTNPRLNIGYADANYSTAALVVNGNVGIGTTAPGEKLEVVGNVISKGTSWTSRTSAADNSWRGLAYGNGLFVAVSSTGTGNRVMTSPDGINWTSRTSAADNNWSIVTYGNGLFVAVASSGTGNRVMTSPDGITWTSRTSAADENWNSVTYGNGLFVAVAGSGTNRVMTSPDGITWTLRSAAVNNIWVSVVYGNGLFVAGSQDGTGNRIMTSPDGITWTSRTSAADNEWRLTYGNGLFVAVSITGTGNRVMTSPDGITWTSRTTPADNDWRRVTYGNGLFVAVAVTGTGNRVMTSPDGITWTLRTTPVDNDWREVVYGNGLFVAVAQTGTGNRVMTSGKQDYIAVSNDNIFQGGTTFKGLVTGTVALSAVGDVRVGTTGTNGCIQRFDGTGIVGTCSSDERLKTNITALGGTLDALTALDFVTYGWNGIAEKEYGRTQGTKVTGVIAQDVEKYFPDLVATDDKGYKTVDLTTLQMYGLSSLKELNLKVTDHIASSSASFASSSATLTDISSKLTLADTETKDTRSLLQAITDQLSTLFTKLVTFAGEVVFKSRVTYEDVDRAGYAVIPEMVKTVRVNYGTPYQYAPIVHISVVIKDQQDDLFIEDIKGVVTDVSSEGFTIMMASLLPRDVTFSWSATSVKDARTTVAPRVISPIPLITPPPITSTPTLAPIQATPTVIPTASPLLTITPSIIPSPTATELPPQYSPTHSPTPTPSPTMTLTPIPTITVPASSPTITPTTTP